MNSTIVRFISLCTFFCLLLQSSESQRLKQGASDWYMRYHGIFDKHKRPQRLQWQTGNEFDGSDFTGNRYTEGKGTKEKLFSVYCIPNQRLIFEGQNS